MEVAVKPEDRFFTPPATHISPHPTSHHRPSQTHLDRKVALGEVPLPLLLLLRHAVLLVGRQVSPHGARELGAEVERQVLLVLVEDAQLRALVGIDDGENAGDALADVVAARRQCPFSHPFGTACPLFCQLFGVWEGGRTSC